MPIFTQTLATIPMRYLNYVLIGIIGILLFMSILALFTIHLKLGSLKFNFSAKGFETYLFSYGAYKSLFVGTVSVCAAYFGLQRVKASMDANQEKVRQDYFNEWKTILELRISEIQHYDDMMNRVIIKKRHAVYQELYESNFKIENKQQLETLFSKYFKDSVKFFEDMNQRHMEMGVYPDEHYSYSFDSFRFVFYGMINESYQRMENDLRALYLANMDPMRLIDKGAYILALQNRPQK